MRNSGRNRLHGIILLTAFLWILWQLWKKVHIVIWVPMPWWAVLLLVLAILVALDLLLDRILGKDDY